MSFTMLPFSGLSPHEFVKIFPKKGDTYKGHSYLNGNWRLNDVCDANDKLYDEYADEYGRWHIIDKPHSSSFSWLKMVEKEIEAL